MIIGGLGVLTAFLAYRVNTLSRKESQPNVNVEWKPPFNLPIHYVDVKKTDLYYLIEAIFTNTGGKIVAATELVAGKGGFLHTVQLIYGQSVTETPYVPTPDLYILPQPIQTYVGKEEIFQTHKGTKQKVINNEVPLDIVIDPGKSVRLSLCFYAKNYKEPAEKGHNHIFSVAVKFNNGQKSSFNVAVGGVLSAAVKSERHNKANSSDAKSGAAD